MPSRLNGKRNVAPKRHPTRAAPATVRWTKPVFLGGWPQSRRTRHWKLALPGRSPGSHPPARIPANERPSLVLRPCRTCPRGSGSRATWPKHEAPAARWPVSGLAESTPATFPEARASSGMCAGTEARSRSETGCVHRTVAGAARVGWRVGATFRFPFNREGMNAFTSTNESHSMQAVGLRAPPTIPPPRISPEPHVPDRRTRRPGRALVVAA